VSEVDSKGGTVLIRRANADDAEALAQFGARTFLEAFGADNSPQDLALHLEGAWHPRLQRAEIADPGLDTLLACDPGGQFAGFAQLRAASAPDCVPTLSPAEITRFYIDRPWQGRGVAHQLMDAVLEQARAHHAREVWLGTWERNLRGQAFYRKYGFRQVGTQVFVVGNDPQTDHVMLLELA
jgi:ribosomal protein S18 acetylase RimI-like enzyme